MAGAVPAEKPPLQHAMLGVANGCFVETVAFLDRWNDSNGADAWARLLQWGAREDEERYGAGTATLGGQNSRWITRNESKWTSWPHRF